MNQAAALNRTLRAIFWAALALGIAAMSLGVRQVDFWWQLPDGLAILATHHLPTAPTTAFGLPATPWVDEYSLYEIGLALLDQLGGLGLIHVAFASVFLLIFALPFASTGYQPRDLRAGALVALAALFVINRFEQRPEIIGVLLLVILLQLLRRTQELNRGFLLRLGLIMAVWTNVHSSYLVGLLALACWLVLRVAGRDTTARWSLPAGVFTLAIACASILINPYGAGRIAFTFAQQGDPGSNLLSPEMWPVWDQAAGVQRLMALTAVALVAALISRPRPPLWLGALASILFLLSLFNIRHISFLAVALLYLAAERRLRVSDEKGSITLSLILATSCLGALLFDFAAVRGAVGTLRASPVDNVQRFAPALMARIQAHAILCHDGAGSYLTFARPDVHPYMDSGQGRFDDATKRLYFFAIYDAAALDRLLTDVPQVDGVLVTAQVEVWSLALTGRRGWYLAACDNNGLFFRRSPNPGDKPGSLNPADALVLAAARDHAMAHGDIERAFCLSVLIDPPETSLRLLDRSSAIDWTDRFYSFTRAWLERVPASAMQEFLLTRPRPANPLLAELLLERMPPSTSLPPVGSTGLEHLARVVTLLDRRQPAEAAATFKAVQKPLVSALYYTLRGQLEPEAARHAPPFERWQDEGSAAPFDRALPLLNARAESPARQ